MSRWIRMLVVAVVVASSWTAVAQLAAPRALAASDVLDQSNPATSPSSLASAIELDNLTLAAQTFTPALTGSMDRIKLILGREGSPPDLTIQIETVNGMGQPSGTVIGSGTVPAGNVPLGSPSGLIDIPLSNPAPVTAGTQYAIVVSCPGCSVEPANTYQVALSSTSYTGGQGLIFTDSAWFTTTFETGFQSYAFQTYVLITPTIATQSVSFIPYGGTANDAANISGGYGTPGGSITFKLFGPNNPSCGGLPAFTSSPVPVNGNGTYQSPFAPGLSPGTYHWIATYSGDASNQGVSTACSDPAETLTVGKASPSISTQALSPIPPGGTATDTATLTGGYFAGSAPTSYIAYMLYGPTDPGCMGSPIFTTYSLVGANGTYTSPPSPPLGAGTYHWIAAYSGDVSNNNPVTAACGATGETTVAHQAVPAISTQASAAITLGGTITDTATLTGGFAPTGSIAFALYGPADPFCGAMPVFTTSKMVTGNGAYPTAPFAPGAAGTYHWVASYGGDSNNISVSTHCGDAGETVTVNKATPTITTQAASPIALGGTATDSANLTGSLTPGGSITFRLYGPSDPACTAAPVFTTVTPVTGTGPYSSAAYLPLAGGTYHWVASYSGDAANAPASTTCGDPGETLAVGGALPSTPKSWVVANTGTSYCPGNPGITLVVNVSDADRPLSGDISLQDPVHGISLVTYQIISLQAVGNTAVVIAYATQNGTPVVVRLVVTAAGPMNCSGRAQVTTSFGYTVNMLPLGNATVGGLPG